MLPEDALQTPGEAEKLLSEDGRGKPAPEGLLLSNMSANAAKFLAPVRMTEAPDAKIPSMLTLPHRLEENCSTCLGFVRGDIISDRQILQSSSEHKQNTSLQAADLHKLQAQARRKQDTSGGSRAGFGRGRHLLWRRRGRRRRAG